MIHVSLLNTCLVGYGLAGRAFHAPTIAATPGLRLHSIVQRHGDSASTDWPTARTLRSIDAALEDSEIQLLVIATPNSSHAPLAARALKAGRHVVVDKPMGVDSAECEGLIALATQQQRMLSVFHNRRWDGDFLTVRDLLAAGTLGRIVAFESNLDRWRPQVSDGWREHDAPGGGILFDLGAHLIDAALTLFGEPRRVSAHVAREREGSNVDDAFDLDLDYPGLRVRLGASTLAASPRPRFAIRGTAGSYVKYGLDPQEAALRAGEFYQGDDWGAEPASAWGELRAIDADGVMQTSVLPTCAGDYRGYYADIAAAIRDGRPPEVTAEQALAVIQRIEQAHRLGVL